MEESIMNFKYKGSKKFCFMYLKMSMFLTVVSFACLAFILIMVLWPQKNSIYYVDVLSGQTELIHTSETLKK